MRKPVQVLVLPYRHCKNKIQFALFKRADLNVWQGIAGGVEEGETFLESCKREANEEAGISYDAPVVELKSMCTMPVVNVTKDFLWGENVYLIYEHCFGIDATNETITLSHEHTKMEWLSFEDAKAKLKWDSNKNALWELNWKLLNNKLDI